VLPSERREVQVAEDSLARFTGLYELDPDTNLIVTMSTGRLAAQVGSGPVRELFAETSTRFFGRSTDLQIHFEQAPAGEVSGIVAHHNGKERRGKRLPELVEVTVPAETLARYTGAYQLGPGIDVIITVEDGRLTATPTGQPKGTLYAAAEDRFFLKTFNAQVEFTREKNGQTTGLILHKAGQHISAIRRSSHVNR
jgi:hypothetical protein